VASGQKNPRAKCEEKSYIMMLHPRQQWGSWIEDLCGAGGAEIGRELSFDSVF